LLHDNCPDSDPLAVTDVSNLQLEQVASPQLAVDAKIEQREFAGAAVGRSLSLALSCQMPPGVDVKRTDLIVSRTS